MKIHPSLKWSFVLLLLALACPGAHAADDCIDISQMDSALAAKVDVLAEGTGRCAGNFAFKTIPKSLYGLPCISIKRGAREEPGSAYTFTIKKPATVYLFVMENGTPTIPAGWEPTPMKALWNINDETSLLDSVYSRHFAAGEVVVPEHDGRAGNFGVPHLCVVVCD